MSRYCMIYFGYSPQKGFRFLEQIIYKNLILKSYLLLLFYRLSFDILEKRKNGVTRLIILQEGQSYLHPPTPKFRG